MASFHEVRQQLPFLITWTADFTIGQTLWLPYQILTLALPQEVDPSHSSKTVTNVHSTRNKSHVARIWAFRSGRCCSDEDYAEKHDTA